MIDKPLTDAELDELEALEEKAPLRQGNPWEWGVNAAWVGDVNSSPGGRLLFYVGGPKCTNDITDSEAELAVAARNALPRLLAEVRLLRKKLKGIDIKTHDPEHCGWDGLGQCPICGEDVGRIL